MGTCLDTEEGATQQQSGSCGCAVSRSTAAHAERAARLAGYLEHHAWAAAQQAVKALVDAYSGDDNVLAASEHAAVGPARHTCACMQP